MKIRRLYDEALSQISYMVESEGEIALIDPGRDTKPFLDIANSIGGRIVSVFETHPHADFASSHLEFYKKHGIDIYINPKVRPRYPFHAIEHNDEVNLGKITIRALFTPGHSPDHNSYLIMDEDGKNSAIFTGDALFVGDVGRPDLREGTGNMKVSKSTLAEMMFNTVNNIFNGLEDEVIVYPAHGPGSLCGKNMGSELESNIGHERKNNWAFQIKDKNEFVEEFLSEQNYIPKYFPYEVELNRSGANPLSESIDKIGIQDSSELKDFNQIFIDVRKDDKFKVKHIKGSMNIPLENDSSKFETWLGSIIDPKEEFVLVGENKEECQMALKRSAKIGYEQNASCVVFTDAERTSVSNNLDLQDFKKHTDRFTVLSVREDSELETEGKIFKEALHIPLHELRERSDEVPRDLPIVVHCAGGYRSAIGASILKSKYDDVKVFDLSDNVDQFKSIGTEQTL